MKVYLTETAIKQYNALPKSEVKKINKKLLLLQQSPSTGKKLSGEYGGCFSIKAWPYRIIYTIDSKENEVWVSLIVHRQGAYKH